MSDEKKSALDDIAVGGLIDIAKSIVSDQFKLWNVTWQSADNYNASLDSIMRLRKINYHQALKNPTAVWEKIRENNVIADFVIDGTIGMLSGLAVSQLEYEQYLHEPLAHSISWLASATHVDDEIKQRSVNKDTLRALFKSDPWITFLLIFQQTYIQTDLSAA